MQFTNVKKTVKRVSFNKRIPLFIVIFKDIYDIENHNRY